MINPVDNSSAAAASAQSSNKASASSGESFASALAKETTAKETKELKPPKGERWEPVAGHPEYADIVSGKRNGFFVNLQPGPRQGKEFLIVQRDGKTYHVYGEGKDREVVRVRDREPRVDPSRFKPEKDETWKDVKGHRDYKDIDGGKRDELYVNLSGNERTGKAFELVKRGDRTFHVYGEGKDRIEIEVGWRKRRAEAGEKS